MTAAEGPVDVKHAGQVPKSFSASVPTSTVKNAASFTSSQTCKYPCDHVCVWDSCSCFLLVGPTKKNLATIFLSLVRNPQFTESGLGSSSQTGLVRAWAVGDTSYKITGKIPSPVKSETEVLLHWLSIPLFIRATYIHTCYIHSYILQDLIIHMY